MDHLSTRNTGVDFLLDNMKTDQFAQTLLGFNTTIRMKLDRNTKLLTVSYECNQFKNWCEVVGDSKIEAALKEKFGSAEEDGVTTFSESGFDLVKPCPDGVSDDTKNMVANLRDSVYQIVLQKVIADAPVGSGRNWKYTDGTAIKLTNKCQAYIYKTAEGPVSCTWVIAPTKNAMETQLIRVFLQEFVTERKKSKLGAAPPVAYRKEGDLPLLEMSFQERHQKNMPEVCRCIYSVPEDLDFHMKASKTFFHHNMHTQVKSWLQVLNRADPSKAEGNKKKKARKSLRQ